MGLFVGYNYISTTLSNAPDEVVIFDKEVSKHKPQLNKKATTTEYSIKKEIALYDGFVSPWRAGLILKELKGKELTNFELKMKIKAIVERKF